MRSPYPIPSRIAWATRIALLATLTCLGQAATAPAPAAGTSADPRFAGRPPLTPRWAFEPWVWEDNGNTQASTEKLVSDYLTHGIPTGAVIVDSPWSTAYTDFEWDRKRYPDPAAMVRDFHEKNVRVVVWLTGCLNIKSKDVPLPDPEYDRVKELGFAVDKGLDFDWWKGHGRHLDFTHPAAREWWARRMDKAASLGIDGWKVDQGEAYLPEKFSTSLGVMDRQTFKLHYYGAMFDYAVSRKTDSLTFARPFSHQDGWAAPIAKCSVGWSGDFSGDWAGLQLQLDNVYQSARRGYGVLAVEVGGFFQKKPTKDQLIRYAQFGALMPVMVNGGENGGLTYHLPWYHDEETVQIYRYFATLHSELGDYLFSSAVDGHLGGGSVVRSPSVEARQHLLGRDLFVSAVVDDTTSKRVTFPAEGRWIDWWNQANVFAAGTTTDYPAPLDRAPLFVRAGAILPMQVRGSLTGNGDAMSAMFKTVVVFPAGKSNLAYHLPHDGGTTYSDVFIAADEKTGVFTISGKSKQRWRLRIKSFTAPKKVSGADRWTYDAENGWLTIDKHAANVKVRVTGLTGYDTRKSASRAP